MSAKPEFNVPFLLGMMRLHENDDLRTPGRVANWIGARLDQGLCWFDHADIYGDRQGETLFGAALRTLPGGPVPVIGTLKPDRIDQLVAGATLTLDRPTWFTLLEAARGERVA